ncbi:MAG: PAS domain S-box protein [Nitrospira sp.]|nr:PAS domain S-box protein [Nitrospira sp.]
MPPKTIKKKSSPKNQTPQSTQRATSTEHLAEEEVLASRDFLRQIIDINPHFIFAKDRDGRFTLANQAVADFYGTTIEDLIGKTDADFNPNKTEVELFLKMDREVMDSKKERFIPEEVIIDVAGKKRWLQTIKRPIIGKDGRANQVLGVSIDITERKQAEEVRVRSDFTRRAQSPGLASVVSLSM